MNENRAARWAAVAGGALSAWGQRLLVPAFLRRRTIGLAVAASVLATLYWGLVASDRYVSEAHVVIQKTDSAGGGAEVSSLLGGLGGSSEADQRLLRDYLLSVDLLQRLDARHHLRAHYSDSRRDPLSRMWSADEPIEWFHRHFLSRVGVEFDPASGVLIVKAQAYDPETARAIVGTMVEEGEKAMNAIGHLLAREQVVFLEKQAAEMSQRLVQAREAAIAFQNRRGLASPQATIENLTSVVNRLESQIAELQAKRAALLGYLSNDAPPVIEVDVQLAAAERQLAIEKSKLAAPSGKTLNTTLEEYQRLQMAAELALDMYKTALVALEKGRLQAIRTLKKVVVLQSPTLPQYPLQPRRIYNTVLFVLVTLLLTSVVHLLVAVIRDHKD